MLAIEGRMEGGVFDFGCPLRIMGEDDGEDADGLRITGGEMAFRWRFGGTGDEPLDLGAMGMALFFTGGGGINLEEEDEEDDDPEGGR